MTSSRWIDHLPPWMAWGAVASTGAYDPAELALMALPLLAAALVEWRRWGLARWRRVLEVLALVFLLLMIWTRMGLVPTLVQVVFFLCGVRLALPRELPQRRQLLLMGFLIWITTAVSTFSIDFLFWALAWVCGTALVLLQQSWERSLGPQHAPRERPPYIRILGWGVATCVLAGSVFLVLPRVSLRAMPWGVPGLTAARAGLSDSLELGETGPIQPSRDVVMRILPPTGISEAQRKQWGQDLALLRGLALEAVDGMNWKPSGDTPPFREALVRDLPEFEFFVAPSPDGMIPVPYGKVRTSPPTGMPIWKGKGGSLRWAFPSRRPVSMRVQIGGPPQLEEYPPGRSRWVQLTQTDGTSDCAERWSRRIAPGNLAPSELATRLSNRFQSFRYTLENPSGSAENPLQDFLEHSQAGHCEYFASALALMLRHRGVPARVVNGYRLGAWVSEGGYWVVTQNEAHSWVEYFDATIRQWKVADPTPAGSSTSMGGASLWASLQRWMDSLSYRWDRYVVRFSDQDQQEGFEWLRSKAAGLSQWRPDWKGPAMQALAYGLFLGLALVILLRWKPRTISGPANTGVSSLRPLLRVTRKTHPPEEDETLRQWLDRLAKIRPDRRSALLELAEQAEAETYGKRPDHLALRLARQEAKAWKAGRQNDR